MMKISRIRVGSWVLVACLAFADMALAAPVTNLVSNGSFDQEVGGKPVGWEPRRWGGEETWRMTREGHARKGCAMIASDKGANFSLATSVAVEHFTRYRLSGWIKTENVVSTNGLGALINIHGMDAATSPALTGTHDWTQVEVVFNTCLQDRLWVHCCLGGWGLATGKAWFDDISLQKIGRYEWDYSYLFTQNSPNAPHIARYISGKTAIAGHAFYGSKPCLMGGKEPVVWRLILGPEGMTVDADSGAPSWEKPTEGRYCVQIEARNSFGHDILEFILIVVKNDIPNGQVVVTEHMDFVLPPEGVAWFEKWKPHALLDAQFEYLRKLIGQEPTGDGKQVVKYQPDMGGGAHSGNPAPVGPGFWSWDDVGGWSLGIWFHEVGHNFNGQAPVAFYSDIEGFGGIYHHHCQFTAGSVFLRTVANPAAFGLSGAAADNYRRWLGPVNPCTYLAEWVKKGGKARTYPADGFHVWGDVCGLLASEYGVEVLEKPLRAMRTDGIPASLRDTAKTPFQKNALLYCIMSHAANADLRPFFDRMGYEYDGKYYLTIDAKVGEIVRNLPDEDDLDGWKKNPDNGHYYRRTLLASNWHASEVEARQYGGHLATIRNATELQWLQSRFGVYGLLWIGFQSANPQRAWKWISGERATFTIWDKGQPAAGRDQCFAVLAPGSGKLQATSSPANVYLGIIEVDTKPLAPRQTDISPRRTGGG